jgi:hypothetical protein
MARVITGPIREDTPKVDLEKVLKLFKETPTAKTREIHTPFLNVKKQINNTLKQISITNTVNADLSSHLREIYEQVISDECQSRIQKIPSRELCNEYLAKLITKDNMQLLINEVQSEIIKTIKKIPNTSALREKDFSELLERIAQQTHENIRRTLTSAVFNYTNSSGEDALSLALQQDNLELFNQFVKTYKPLDSSKVPLDLVPEENSIHYTKELNVIIQNLDQLERGPKPKSLTKSSATSNLISKMRVKAPKGLVKIAVTLGDASVDLAPPKATVSADSDPSATASDVRRQTRDVIEPDKLRPVVKITATSTGDKTAHSPGGTTLVAYKPWHISSGKEGAEQDFVIYANGEKTEAVSAEKHGLKIKSTLANNVNEKLAK